MTKEKLIDMARQAGFDPHDMSSDFTCNLENINAFAKLIAEKAIKEALAQLEQEPVAWEQFYPDIGKPKFVTQPEQEPIGYVNKGETDRLIAQKQETIEGLNRDYDLLFAEHQLLLKKEWVDLTDDEIFKIYIAVTGEVYKSHKTYAHAIDAKLKEKNTRGQE